MALEPAGVSLQAEGFRQYIKNLDEIEKKQRAAFEAEFKGTSKSYAEVTRAAKAYEKQLDDTVKAEQKAAQQAEKAAKKRIDATKKVRLEQEKLAAAQKIAAATQIQATLSVAQTAIGTTKQIAQAAFELGKLGARFQGQQVGLSNLAASFGQSGTAIQKAIQKASSGTISGLDAIQAANTALLFGVAKTPEEFSKLTSSALTLGRTLGLNATQSIEQFTTALGRQSLLILDNFGISAKQVNAEIERLAQVDFGKARSQLSDAEKSATFMKAALNIAGKAAATIGEEAGKAQASFDRLTASASDFKTELGVAVSDLNQTLGITEFITKNIVSATQSLQFSKGVSPTAGIDKQITTTEIGIKDLEAAIERVKATQKGGILGALFGGNAEANVRTIEKLEERIGLFKQKLDDLNLQKAAEDQKKFGDATDTTTGKIETSAEAIKGYEAALKQAQALQLSFAREGEDAARKLARATEDLAIKQERANVDLAKSRAKSIGALQKTQKKNRDKLLNDQIKQLAKFDIDRKKQISKAEDKIRKEQKQAGDERKREQRKLQQDLLRAQDQFNLSQLQSERRFKLQETRLRAEGDIIGLKELREDFALTKQEEKENFDFSRKEQVKSGKDQLKEQEKVSNDKIKDLKANIDDQRAELLTSFDEQLEVQRQAQAESKELQRQKFIEEDTERQIALQRQEDDRARALQREEEDRRISQRRQLEDLGQALAEQKDVTAQGVNAIAEEIERVFGMAGVANNIIVGFSERTRNEFNELVDSVEETIKSLEEVEKKRDVPLVALTGDTRRGLSSGGFGGRRTTSGIQQFGDGGIVEGPGPIGSPQPVMAHIGETFIPTHQRSFQMAAPVIPSQNLNVNMGGEFKITGDGQGDEKILQAAAAEVTENFRIAVERIARRN